jgi:hypothetical protein
VALVTLLVYEAEVFPAVHVQEARQQIPGRSFGLLKPAGMEEAKGRLRAGSSPWSMCRT